MLKYIREGMRAQKDRGASAVEYGLMVAAVAALIVGVVFALGHVVGDIFSNSCTSIQTSTTPQGTQNCAAP